MAKALSPFAILLATLTGVGLLASHGGVQACTLDRPETHEERLADQVAAADLIVVGRVIEEAVVGQRGGDPPTPTYASTIEVRAVLVGAYDESTLRLTPLGWLSALCTGGPRLLEGERVLLFLALPSQLDQEEGFENSKWQGVLAGAKYFFARRPGLLRDRFQLRIRPPAAAGRRRRRIDRHRGGSGAERRSGDRPRRPGGARRGC